MVRIEIPDRHPLRAISKCIKRGDRDVIEKAKPHRLVPRRMMPRRPHQAERALSA